MVRLKCKPWQLNYLYYIFTFYACCSESTHDKIYILTGAEIQQKISKLSKKQKASYTLKLSALESLLFSECITMYLDSIKLDKKLIIEKIYLSQLYNETRQTTN
jgi:hypothetical protein